MIIKCFITLSCVAFNFSIIFQLIIAVSPAAWAQSFVIVARSLNTLIVLCGLLWLAYGIVQMHPVVNMLYLTYP